MIKIRKSKERGLTDLNWLKSFHTFSFGEYYDPQNMSFRTLRVINDDWVKGGRGFDTHPHRDMEIITYVLEGSLAHKDSMGNGSAINPGEVQLMSAGTGVAHSEYNHSKKEEVRLLQIWIIPDQKGLAPSYQQRDFKIKENKNKLCLLVSKDGRDNSLTIHQDAHVFAAWLLKTSQINYPIKPNRHVWIQLARGKINLNGQLLSEGDGAAVDNEKSLMIQAQEESEILLFDLE